MATGSATANGVRRDRNQRTAQAAQLQKRRSEQATKRMADILASEARSGNSAVACTHCKQVKLPDDFAFLASGMRRNRMCRMCIDSSQQSSQRRKRKRCQNTYQVKMDSILSPCEYSQAVCDPDHDVHDHCDAEIRDIIAVLAAKSSYRPWQDAISNARHTIMPDVQLDANFDTDVATWTAYLCHDRTLAEQYQLIFHAPFPEYLPPPAELSLTFEHALKCLLIQPRCVAIDIRLTNFKFLRTCLDCDRQRIPKHVQLGGIDTTVACLLDQCDPIAWHPNLLQVDAELKFEMVACLSSLIFGDRHIAGSSYRADKADRIAVVTGYTGHLFRRFSHILRTYLENIDLCKNCILAILYIVATVRNRDRSADVEVHAAISAAAHHHQANINAPSAITSNGLVHTYALFWTMGHVQLTERVLPRLMQSIECKE